MSLLLLCVGGAVLIVHGPVLRAQALCFDDPEYLTENALVRNPSWGTAARFLTEVLAPSSVAGYYQPLTMISLMVDYALTGRTDDLRPFHCTNLALHVANTLLVVVLMYLLFNHLGAAAAAGVLFGLHPVTVEPVAWVCERKSLLATSFALGSLILYVWSLRRRRTWFLVGALAMFVPALLSKPSTLSLPLLMLVLDWWPLRQLTGRALLSKVPFVLLAVTSAGITFVSQDRTLVAAVPTDYSPTLVPLLLCHNMVFYLGKILWPVSLSAFYPFPESFDLSNPIVLLGVVGTAVLVGAVLISLRWTRAWAACLLFFLLALLPASGVVGFTHAIASPKYVYLPMIGLVLLVTWGLGRVWGSSVSRRPMVARSGGVPGVARSSGVPASRHGAGPCAGIRDIDHGPGTILSNSSGTVPPPLNTPTAWAVAMAVLALCVVAAGAETVAVRRHLEHWQDTERLFRYMLTIAPQAGILRYNLAEELRAQGRIPEAMDELRGALRCSFGSPFSCNEFVISDAHNNLGNLLAGEGKIDEALSEWTQALKYRPDNYRVHNNVGIALGWRGRTDESIQHFEQALRLNPKSAETHNNLARQLVVKEHFDEALRHYREAIQLAPDFVVAYRNLAAALERTGRMAEAADAYRQALRLDPQDEQIRTRLEALSHGPTGR